MSGGHFDYDQYRIGHIARAVSDLIVNNTDDRTDDYGDTRGRFYSAETIAEFRKGLAYLKLAEIYAQRIDWLVSGDDGEESFHDRLQDELSDLLKIDPLVGDLLVDNEINRLEVIDHTGRAYTLRDQSALRIQPQLQDSGKTLKIFVDKDSP